MINTHSLPSAKTVMNKPKYEVKLMPQLEKACGPIYTKIKSLDLFPIRKARAADEGIWNLYR